MYYSHLVVSIISDKRSNNIDLSHEDAYKIVQSQYPDLIENFLIEIGVHKGEFKKLPSELLKPIQITFQVPPEQIVSTSETLTPKEVSLLLKVTKHTVNRWCKNGLLECSTDTKNGYRSIQRSSLLNLSLKRCNDIEVK